MNTTFNTTDTIAAIATPQGIGGIGVIRVSGPDAFQMVLPLLQYPNTRKNGQVPPSHRLTYGRIVELQTGEVLDDVLVAFMSAPHTYTREDVVEIQGHGGPLVLRRILRAVLEQGARMAQPGEFTLRAFLNGRIDLAQAEAVMDLIGAQTEAGQRLAMQQLHGRLSEQVQAVRHAVINVIARIEVSIDFPEEDVPTPEASELHPLISDAQQQLATLLAGSEQGRLYRQGLRTAIIGRPNVGKSSLLNALLRTERAIVTPVAGTTRDTVEEVANLRGVPLHLIDTAGITPSDDPVEQLGVQRSRAAASNADVVLLVFDGSEPLIEQDRLVSNELRAMGFADNADNVDNGNDIDTTHSDASQYKNSEYTLYKRTVVVVVNKSDRESRIEQAELHRLWPSASFVETSTLTGTGITELEETLADLVLSGKTVSGESVLVTSERHQDALRRASSHLKAAQTTLNNGLPLDFVSIDLRAAYDALGEVTGETASDSLLDEIFSEFCIGK